MSNIFQSINVRKPKLNKFDLSHEKKLSMKMGNLYPILLQEVVPGDSFKGKSEIMLRLAPMLAPVMHRVNVYTHYFFVPNRIIWDEWEDFITGGEDGNKLPVHPKMNMSDGNRGQYAKGTLADYLGLPIPNTAGIQPNAYFSSLPFRAYQTIYNEYFRDQNLETKIPVPKTSGTDTNTQELTTLRKRAWEKDYLTSSLPWPQRGGEASLPAANVTPNYKSVATVIGASSLSGSIDKNIDGTIEVNGSSNKIGIENIDDFTITGTTINDLRKANKLQEWLEKSARGGSRYIEQILSHFGVKSSDARLQRPEYIGGGRQAVVISEVLNTAGDAAGTQLQAVGDMAGHGISVGANNKFGKKMEEHGYIIGICSVLPRTAYQQGLQRHWTKFDKFDHYWPEFANLGEQEVYMSEAYSDFTDATALTRVFGYQQRFAEYKYQESSVAGDFRDNLAYWHMGRIFQNEPVLNKDFVMSDPTKRIFAVEDTNVDELYVQVYNQISALRPMPYFSIPSLT